MKKKSIKINAVLNIIKSLLSVVFPLITYPYAARVLGSENLGKVNYCSSIVSYFSLLAAFGVTSYAIREGARVRDNKKKFSKLANEMFTINIVTTIIAYVFLFAAVYFVNKLHHYRLLILLQSLTIIFTTFGVDWINTIYEDFFFTTIRGIITHVIALVLLFILVKHKEDYYLYAMLTVVSNAIMCVINYFYCKRYAKIQITRKPNLSKHLPAMSVFFVNAVAVSIYVNADTTMLGWMVGDNAVGIYSVAVKIYSIMKLMLVAIYSVALPRLSFYFGHGDHENYRKLFSEIVSVLLLLLLPASAGIYMLSPQIILLIGGNEFITGAKSLEILSIALIFAILGGVLSQCMNISLGKEKINAFATIVSAIFNILLNIPFITHMQENGAAITTAISEAIVLFICSIYGRNLLKKYLDIRVLKNVIHSILGVILVIVICTTVKSYDMGIWGTLIISMFVSIAVYGVILIILKNDVVLLALKNLKRIKEK